jgi:hypothetical protein
VLGVRAASIPFNEAMRSTKGQLPPLRVVDFTTTSDTHIPRCWGQTHTRHLVLHLGCKKIVTTFVCQE